MEQQSPSSVNSFICAAIVLHDDNCFLDSVIKSLGEVPCTVFVSRLPWSGQPGNWEKSVQIAKQNGAEVILGDWKDENSHRKAVLDEMKRRKIKQLIIPDSDEIIEPSLLDNLITLANSDLAEQVRCRMATYWKDTAHVVQPPEQLAALIMISPDICQHNYIREYTGGRLIVLTEDHGLLHHLSYVGDDERIRRKITCWGHKDEVVENWWEKKWKEWDRDPSIKNLHPTHPDAYYSIVRIPIPDILKDVVFEEQFPPISLDYDWPSVSIVIPLYGGRDDIELCLSNLEPALDVIHEVIVIDDVSPDDAPDAVRNFSFARLIRRKENSGFAAACNDGALHSTGEIIIFLNSDAILTRSALIRLVEGLLCDDSVGAAGPITNNIGSPVQKHDIPYKNTSTIGQTAQDIAYRDSPNVPVSILIGFCFCIRRSLFDSLKGFDYRFEVGMFEDNDLSYRIQRIGLKLVVSTKSFVYHKGSQSLARIEESSSSIFRRNEKLFREKWNKELITGFASHLSGDSIEPIKFRHELEPEALSMRMRSLAIDADISLCMIVRNEERVLDACLNSVADVFSQIIVIDTGSSDSTIEIAKQHGAEVYEIEWPMSFSIARNESLKYAKGKWIFWMDADDTLPIQSAETILRAALDADDETVGYVIPVQFVEKGRAVGTRVDHVKLFRNISGLAFEGRIHEQILPSLRTLGGNIVRLDAHVLHSGYDTSEEGQAKKRKRDATLLQLDLEERPHHPFVLFNLGMTAHYTNSHAEAVKWFDECLKVSNATESHVRKAFVLKGASLVKLNQLEKALAVYNHGLSFTPSDAELLFQKARLLSSMGRNQEARLCYEQIPNASPDHFSSIDTGIQGAKRLHNLGIVCAEAGDNIAAVYYWKLCLERFESETNTAIALFENSVQRHDFLTAEIGLRYIAKELGYTEQWSVMLRRLCDLQGLRTTDVIKRMIDKAPSNARLQLCLVRILLEEGRLDEALPIARTLDSWCYPEASFYLGIAAFRSGELERAKSLLQRSRELDPDNPLPTQRIEEINALLKQNKKS